MKNQRLKIKILLLGIVVIVGLSSMADVPRTMFGVSVDEATIKSDHGGGLCWYTANAKQFFFWITVDTGQAVMYYDCETGVSTGKWILY